MQNGVPYTEYDIAHDRKRADEMMRISGQDFVPVFTVDSEVITGFNEQKLVDLLRQRSD